MEIERKFLVPCLRRAMTPHPFHQIEQAYLCTEPVVRIRQEDDSFYLTYKGKGLLSREEYNLPLTREAYATCSPRPTAWYSPKNAISSRWMAQTI